MPDRDVVLAKIGNIQRCLRRIKEVTNLNPDSLDNIDKQDMFVYLAKRQTTSLNREIGQKAGGIHF